MKKSFIVTLSKLIALILIFVAPTIYLLISYGGSTTETRVVEVTTNSMPMVILILVSVIVMGGIAYVGSATMNAIKDSPFGFGGIFMFGSIMGGISFLGIYWVDKITDLINYDTTQFITDLATYRHSIQVILAYIVSGLVIATGGFIYQKTR